MMKNRPKMASNGPDGPILSIFGPFSAFAFPFGPKNEKIGSNKAFHHYGAQGAPRVNADVGTGIYMATARTMDPPQLRNEGHGRRGNDIGNEARNSR